MVQFSGVQLLGDFSTNHPVIVLLHSSLSSSKQWWALTSHTKSAYRVINVDLLSYGQADKVQDEKNYSFEVEKQRITQVLRHYNIDRFHLVGHSFGGALALKLAVEQPRSVLSLSLFEPVAFHLLPKDSADYDEAVTFSTNVLNSEPYQAAEVFTNYWNTPGFFVGLPQKMQDLMAADMPKVNLDFQALMAERYSVEDVNVIQAPVLLMKGSLSTHLAHQIIKLLLQSLPHATLKTFKAGHMAPVSHAQEVQAEIYQFITST
ncbi:alpha/beta hydrolase [Thalassotalea sp. LPB0316]|uniref:alpha/beta fold hydrolase n=1 Tax=Thalassotalea sp. LPB0316 TaxID=2769490 RepID=UPI001867B906|nr:alpha/beta hydrolase [Thalassotalea sp. LPB0316]QOL24495.1 alpha/beta hydrolase [Thalassotalea sp. LPB0316]